MLTDDQITAIADKHATLEPDGLYLYTNFDSKSSLIAFVRECIALAVTRAPAVPATPTHRHIARGTLYTELGRGTLQTAVPLTDMTELVAYVGENGQWWFRAPSEFDDDERFALIDPDRTPTAGNTEDARSMGAVSDTQMLDFLARLGDFAAGSVPSIPHDYEVRTEDDRVFKGESLRDCIRAALTQAASTGGAAS